MLSLATVAAKLLVSVEPPAVPQMWTATVNELDVGVCKEAQHFVWGSAITKENPSALWMNLTDGKGNEVGCNRLFYSNADTLENSTNAIFMLGCDRTPCCHINKDYDGGPIPYKIPDTFGKYQPKVTSLGKQNITQWDGTVVNADVWMWRDLLVEAVYAYTVPGKTNGTALMVKWAPKVEGKSYPTEFKDFTPVAKEDEAALVATYTPPTKPGQVCHKSPHCSQEHAAGRLSTKMYEWAKAGNQRHRDQKAFQAAVAAAAASSDVAA